MSWTLIEHQALSSSAASVTLGSGGTIPQTYKTLMLVTSMRSARTGQTTNDAHLTVNGSSSSYSERMLYYNEPNGASIATSGSLINWGGIHPAANATASTFGNGCIIFPNYSSTTANKPISIDNVSESNATGFIAAHMTAALWSNTSAITSITLASASSTFNSGSTFTLYGLA